MSSGRDSTAEHRKPARSEYDSTTDHLSGSDQNFSRTPSDSSPQSPARGAGVPPVAQTDRVIAVDLGYRCITVSDASASGDPSMHKAALAMIGVEGGIFGEVVTTSEVVTRLA